MSSPEEVALAAAIGVAVSEPIKRAVGELWDVGRRWIVERYARHREEARLRAERQGLQFAALLAAELERSEKQGTGVDVVAQLSDPDFAALLEAAFVASARTPSEAKHQLLAKLVADRLLVLPDTMQSVATTLAVEAVSRLTEEHLLHLGALSVVYVLRPCDPPGGRPWTDADWERYVSWLTEWTRPFRDVSPLGDFEALHLAACQVAQFSTMGFRILDQVLRPEEVDDADGQVEARLDPATREWLVVRWEQCWGRLFPTPAGMLVGVTVCRNLGLDASFSFDVAHHPVRDIV